MTALLCFVLVGALGVVVWLLMEVATERYEIKTAFECGFTPQTSPRISFSIRFFLLTVLFVIFDVELLLVIPMILFGYLGLGLTLNILVFVIVLWGGLLHEWREGSLYWNTY